QHAYKTLGLRRENSPFAQHHAVRSARKKFSSRNDFEPFLSGNTNAHDDRNAKAEFDIFFDDFPAADFHRHLIREPVLFESAVHEAPSAEIARRQDERISAD